MADWDYGLGRFGSSNVEIEFSPDDASATARSEPLTPDQRAALEALLSSPDKDQGIGTVVLCRYLGDAEEDEEREREEVRSIIVTDGVFEDDVFVIHGVAEDSGGGT